MSACAVCLVTDANYMFPTLVAAAQARRALSPAAGDVIIFAASLSPAMVDRYRAVCEAERVGLQLVSRDIYGGAKENQAIDAFFASSKFSFGALGRFFLDHVAPPKYDQLLYLDGDIQIQGPLDALAAAPVPDGMFLAAPDPKVFWINMDTAAAERERQYMRGLGKATPFDFSSYFNSGVLRMARSGWRDIGERAFAYLLERPELCKCHDQSALNATSSDRRLPLSLRWNFPPFLRYYGLEPRIAPQIVHFMSHPKPWNGAFPPWGAAEHEVYAEFVRRHPQLREDFRPFGAKLTARYHLQQRLKRLDEAVHPARGRTVVANVEAHEQLAFA